jgi:hypothetical protein
METSNTQYPIKRTEIKNFPILKGLSKTIINILTTGIVLAQAFEGDYTLNPYNLSISMQQE